MAREQSTSSGWAKNVNFFPFRSLIFIASFHLTTAGYLTSVFENFHTLWLCHVPMGFKQGQGLKAVPKAYRVFPWSMVSLVLQVWPPSAASEPWDTEIFAWIANVCLGNISACVSLPQTLIQLVLGVAFCMIS